MPFANLDEVKAANAALGHHWFEPDTMQFFDTRIETELLYAHSRWPSFVYSNHFHPSDPAEQSHYPRHYKVALVRPNGDFLSVPNSEYRTVREALVALAILTIDHQDGWA